MTTTSANVPRMRRINFRVLILLALVLLPVLFVLWQFLKPNVIEHGDYADVDLRWLSDFELDQQAATDADIPDDRRALDGKRVLLRGEMWRPDALQGPVKNFQLVFSISKCCVTSNPKIQHFIKSQVVEGKSANAYPESAVEVMGTLHAGVLRDKVSNRVQSVYRLDVESVKLLTGGGWGPLLWLGSASAAALLVLGIVWLFRRRSTARGW